MLFQVVFRRINRSVNGGGFPTACTANAAIVAIPCAPHYRAFSFLDVDRIAYALSHVIQFLNLFGCHSTHLLRLCSKSRTKRRQCPAAKPTPMLPPREKATRKGSDL